jgi:uncharacterized membrane protein YfhO
LYVHITDLPGWNATIDGHPLVLHDWGGTMLTASVPPGRHVIVIRYAPAAFRIGVVLAFLTAAILLVVVIWSLRRSSRRKPATANQTATMPQLWSNS